MIKWQKTREECPLVVCSNKIFRLFKLQTTSVQFLKRLAMLLQTLWKKFRYLSSGHSVRADVSCFVFFCRKDLL